MSSFDIYTLNNFPLVLILALVLATHDLIWKIDRINVAINPERQDVIMGLPR